MLSPAPGWLVDAPPPDIVPPLGMADDLPPAGAPVFWQTLPQAMPAGEPLGLSPATPAAPSATLQPTPRPPAIPGGMGRGGFGGPGDRPANAYRATWYPDQPVSAQPARLGFVKQELSAAFPLWTNGRDVVLATAHVRNETFATSAILQEADEPFPDQLWDVKAGTSYIHPLDNGWLTMAQVSVGSASDKPFHSGREMTVSAMGMLRVPHREQNAWMFFLVYSTNSQILYNLPIPGVAYAWKASDRWEGMVGIPFVALKHSATENLRFELFYALLTTIKAYAVYRLSPDLQWRTGFDWLNESYLRAERAEDRLRFNYDEKRLISGLRWDVGRHWTIDALGGFAFDRRWFESTDFTLSNRNRVDVGNTLFVSLEGSLRF